MLAGKSCCKYANEGAIPLRTDCGKRTSGKCHKGHEKRCIRVISGLVVLERGELLNDWMLKTNAKGERLKELVDSSR